MKSAHVQALDGAIRAPSRRQRACRRLSATVGAFGMTGALMFGPCAPTAPSGIVLQAKPVEAPCTYRDTYGDPRSGGRVHLGVDIMAAEGNDLYAVVSGVVTKVYSDYSLAGNGLRIAQPDGTYFFYAHLLRLAPGMVREPEGRTGARGRERLVCDRRT